MLLVPRVIRVVVRELLVVVHCPKKIKNVNNRVEVFDRLMDDAQFFAFLDVSQRNIEAFGHVHLSPLFLS